MSWEFEELIDVQSYVTGMEVILAGSRINSQSSYQRPRGFGGQTLVFGGGELNVVGKNEVVYRQVID